jgi:CDP-diacylglycerol---glycerol-3-phosphate 3-phosphatidyltransferase
MSDKPKRVPRYHPGKRLTPANGVTVARILITPVMLYLLAQRKFDWLTFILGVVVSASDLIDGMLARRLGTTSSGAFLDPLADKFFVLGSMVVLAWKRAFWWPPVIVIMLREVWISIYRARLSKKGISLPARKLAKWKTLVQQFALGFACAPWIGRHWPWAGHVTLLVAMVLTLWSGALYFVDARRGMSGIPSSQQV